MQLNEVRSELAPGGQLDPGEVAKAAVEAAPDTDAVRDIALATVESVPEEAKKDVAQAAVEAVPPEDKKEVAEAALQGLTAKDLLELRDKTFPQESADRMKVFLVGFIVAGAVVIALALIAWGASGEDSSTSNSILVLGTAFTSAILGGLLGAYKGAA